MQDTKSNLSSLSPKLNTPTENFKTMKTFNVAVKEYLRNKSDMKSLEINKCLAVK